MERYIFSVTIETDCPDPKTIELIIRNALWQENLRRNWIRLID